MPSVLITGASKGIGYETALAFARAGYRVHATMRNPAGAPGLAAVAAGEGLAIHVTAMDVDDDELVRAGMEAIEAEYGPVDVLVNNAGIECFGSVEETPMRDFRAVMETNFFGALRCIKAVAPGMRERRSGTMINVSSISGRFSNPPGTPYAASKWALEALCEGLACEMKMFGVRVVLVEPGLIDTAMAQRLSKMGDSVYPHSARLAEIFAQTLKTAPVPPSVVAEKILAVAQSDSWQLRYLVGPDAEGFIAWRKSMTDEQWVDLHSA